MSHAIFLRSVLLVSCVTYFGIARAQDLPPSNTGDNVPPSSVYGNSILSVAPEYSLSPNGLQSPITTSPQHVAVTSSFDADSIGNRSAYLDSTFAPVSGIYESGILFRVTGNASWYRFLTGENPTSIGNGRYLEGSVLAGYSLWLPGFSVTGLVGPAYGDIINEGVTTTRWGAKGVLEISAKPTNWSMASASISYATITNNLQVQAKAGVKLFGNFYLGPEAKLNWQQILPWRVDFSSLGSPITTPVSSQTDIANMRLGVHLSAFAIGPAVIGVSAGWAHDRQLGSGYYGGVNLYLPF